MSYTPNVSAEKLVEAGAHFGHQMRRWNPHMKEYMYDVRDNTFIFDLVQTKALFDEALAFLNEASNAGKKILVVGTKKQIKDEIAVFAKEIGAFYINERWLGGIFTNFEQMKRSLRKLQTLKDGMAKGEFASYTKKERLMISREIAKLERMVGGLDGLTALPDVMIIIDVHKEKTALRESVRMNIPVVAIVDSNADPREVTFPIPMNDDATTAVTYALSQMKEAVLAKSAPVKKVEKKEPKEKKATAKKTTKVKKDDK